jgi:hypothetical protein
LAFLQKMVKDDGQVAPEFADADEGVIHFLYIVIFLFVFHANILNQSNQIFTHLQKSYMSFLISKWRVI